HQTRYRRGVTHELRHHRVSRWCLVDLFAELLHGPTRLYRTQEEFCSVDRLDDFQQDAVLFCDGALPAQCYAEIIKNSVERVCGYQIVVLGIFGEYALTRKLLEYALGRIEFLVSECGGDPLVVELAELLEGAIEPHRIWGTRFIHLDQGIFIIPSLNGIRWSKR